MQSVLSKIWTRIAMSISYDDNHYTTGTSAKSCLYMVWFVIEKFVGSIIFKWVQVKWFQVLLFIVGRQLNGDKYSYLTLIIVSNINHLFTM